MSDQKGSGELYWVRATLDERTRHVVRLNGDPEMPEGATHSRRTPHGVSWYRIEVGRVMFFNPLVGEWLDETSRVLDLVLITKDHDEARESAAKDLFAILNPDCKWHKMTEDRKEHYRLAIDAGYGK